jgi:DNA polymerase
MVKKLHTDIETYSDIDITESGSYRYIEDPSFEILMVAWAFDDEPVQYVDLTVDELPAAYVKALKDPKIEKHAHNANFERNAFRKYGIDVPAAQWRCSSVKAAYCGLPLGLGPASIALKLGDGGKSSEGKALITFFCSPIKPTKANGFRTRNRPEDDWIKWIAFIKYMCQDVEAERNIDRILEPYTIPADVYLDYILDQKINDRGVLIDTVLATNAVMFNEENVKPMAVRVKELTGLEKPNSPPQLKAWLSKALGKSVTSLTKESIPILIALATSMNAYEASEVLTLRQKMAKTSISKYVAMLACVCEDLRVRGIHQFYGAGRTGRWAGRLVQPQNMPKNFIKFLDQAREVLFGGDYEVAAMLYDEISNILSQLTRTAIIASKGCTLGVADFSSIEARILAWLANEQWKLKVFNTHGKIYEAAAAKMFNVPVGSITKDSDYRAKGKVAELALGYQGAIGALKTMGGEAMGLSDSEMDSIVVKWRAANPAIVSLWAELEKCAVRAIKTRKPIISAYKGLVFHCDDKALRIKLPSGRELMYWGAQLQKETVKFKGREWEKETITYMGTHTKTKQWVRLTTYGGKITENVVQAIARDVLALAMRRVDALGFDIVMHVHDEIIAELSLIEPDYDLGLICEIMSRPIEWAQGLPLGAEGYNTPFYKKD